MKLPEKFELRMKNMLGKEYTNFIKAMEENPVYAGIRINRKKDNAKKYVLSEFGECEKIPWCSDGYYVNRENVSGNHPYHIAGIFYFQEPSAMSTVSAININEEDFVLDLCAAPGGKSTQAAAMIGNGGLLVANEIVKNRANILSENIERMGILNAVVTNETPQRLAEKYPNFFDKIIVDAPCSGEGMFRKEPQAVEEWSVEHTVSCGVRQKNILDSAVKMLKGDGYLLYSTCTFAPEENEQVCAYLLQNYNLELVKPQNLDMLDSGKTEWSNSEFDMSYTRRIFPHKQKGEGHFVAVFKNNDVTESETAKRKIKKCDGENLYRDFEKEFLNTNLKGEFCMFGENLYLKPESIDIDKIKVVRAGLHLGLCRKGRFIPSHALCLALSKNDFKNTVNLSCKSSEIKKYLMGETLECDKKGWCCVLVDGFPIGWGKSSAGVLKNHFPKYMRLKK